MQEADASPTAPEAQLVLKGANGLRDAGRGDRVARPGQGGGRVATSHETNRRTV